MSGWEDTRPMAAADMVPFIREINQRDREIERLRAALKKIARRGVVSDAKGTWSQEVHRIASTALNEKRPTPEGIGRTTGVAAPTVEDSTHST